MGTFSEKAAKSKTIESLMYFGDLSHEDASKAFCYYSLAGIVVRGQPGVRHGIYLEREAIRHAAKLWLG